MPGNRISLSQNMHEHFKEAPEWCVLSDVDLSVIEKSAVCKEYRIGELLFDENAPCEGVYFITSGLVGVRKTTLEGDSTLLKLAYPNDTLGYRPLLAQENHQASAEALKPTIVCFISSSVVTPMIAKNPSLGLNFLQRAAAELGRAEERYHQSVTLSLRERFAHLLLVMRDRCGQVEDSGKLLLDLPVSRKDLASMLGVRRESVSRLLQKLEKEGITHTANRHFEIESPSKLFASLYH